MSPAASEPDPILQAIRVFVADTFRDGNRDGLGPDTSLVTSGLVDSSGVLLVVQFLESCFGIVLGDDDVRLENFDTLAALAALVRAKLGARRWEGRRARA